MPMKSYEFEAHKELYRFVLLPLRSWSGTACIPLLSSEQLQPTTVSSSPPTSRDRYPSSLAVESVAITSSPSSNRKHREISSRNHRENGGGFLLLLHRRNDIAGLTKSRRNRDRILTESHRFDLRFQSRMGTKHTTEEISLPPPLPEKDRLPPPSSTLPEVARCPSAVVGGGGHDWWTVSFEELVVFGFGLALSRLGDGVLFSDHDHKRPRTGELTGVMGLRFES
ncbi:hypothetical protein Dsin_005904 [Dipteronia sinensis]|uniref:Uncharacterized protein n=1 Tax=Dipteronia sinensis TaxID=43782 RepID=A0AAE0EFM7_9ROSI|nr:hypothetical protein Dsin_005904 [Dipteronia sinensis]